MQYAQLGKTDLKVSRICFGCWQLSPSFWGEIPLEPWRQALGQALNLGVNFIDTADAYGNGFSEEKLGEWMEENRVRDKFIVATKFYWNFEQEERHPDTRYDYIIRECEASLRRLRTDVIDLYQIHFWDPLTRPEEVAAAFFQLRREGKVRWFGLSNCTSDQIRMYNAYFDVESLQPLYNLLDRDFENTTQPVCQEKRIGVIPYSPLHNGLLTGKYDPSQTFDDFRGKRPLFQPGAFQRILEGVNELKPLAEKYGLTLPQLAIRWILTNPAITSAIVGIKKPEHIVDIVPAAGDPLAIDDWHRIGRIIAKAKSEALAMKGAKKP